MHPRDSESSFCQFETARNVTIAAKRLDYVTMRFPDPILKEFARRNK